MADQWISCAKALEIVGGPDPGFFDKQSLVNGAAKGRIRARALCYIEFDEFEQAAWEGYDCELPAAFWNFDEANELSNDWVTGAFEKIVLSLRFCATGVSFNLEEVLELVPIEKRATILRSLSVASNVDWISTRSARAMLVADGQLSENDAEGLLLDYCQQGLVVARAVRFGLTWKADANGPNIDRRECDIPLWFWREFATATTSVLDWTRGHFSGEALHEGCETKVTLTGVYLLRSSLETIHRPAELQEVKTKAIKKPPLPKPDLYKWWKSMANVRDSLTQVELLDQIRSKFPQYFVSRERLYKVIGSRKTGPKPFRGKSSAK